MLPHLLKKQPAFSGILVKTRATDNPEEKHEDKIEVTEEMIACAHDLMSALESKDSKRVAQAIYSAFQLAELEPHSETEDHSPHTYDHQNMKAGE